MLVFSVLVTVCSFTLVVTLLQATESVAAEPELGNLVQSLPAIASPPVEAEPSAFPQGRFTESDEHSKLSTRQLLEAFKRNSPLEVPGIRLKDFDPSNAEVRSRSEFATTYRTADGTNVTTLSLVPVNVRGADGRWTKASTKITDRRNGRWGVEQNALRPTFADRAGDQALLTVSRDGFEVSFALEGTADSPMRRPYGNRMQPDLDTMEYPEVFEDVDLRYDVSTGAVKETLVLKAPPAADANSWAWLVSAPGLTLQVNEVGEIEFIDKAGRVRFHIPTPIAWDSSGIDEVREPALTNLHATVARSGSKWRLELSADSAWLTDPERVYPVMVDPTLSVGESYIRAYKSDGYVRTDAVQVGNSRTGGRNTYWRTGAKYPYTSLAGKQVLDATFYGDYWHYGTTTTRTQRVSQNQCWGYHCVGPTLGSFSLRTGVGSTSATALAQLYANLVNSGSLNASLMIRGEETATYTYKQLNTWLAIAWKDYPAVTGFAAPSPDDGATGTPVMPTFRVTASDPGGHGLAYQYKVGTTSDVEASAVYTSPWSSSPEHQVPPQDQLDAGTTYYWKAYVKDGYDGHLNTSTVRGSSVRSFTTNAPAPTPDRATASPVDDAVVTTLTPQFSSSTVVDPEGSPVEYQFRIATGVDGKSGAIISSGWLPTPEWTVPAGTLQDGGTYTWVVLTSDGTNTDIDGAWVNSFKVNLRIGSAGPAPTDAAGPVTVNLANGNVSLGFTSPTVATVGGPMGLSFAYNSLTSPESVKGLTGRYYNAKASPTSEPSYEFAGKQPVLVRTDPAVSFDWADGSPAPAVPDDHYLARWTGFITPPATGSYEFVTNSNDGVRLRVDGNLLIDAWDTASSIETATTALTMDPVPVSIQLDFYEASGTSSVALLVKVDGGAAIPVPPDWFSTEVPTLPLGWTGSAPINGTSGVYASAEVTESSVILTDITGAVHTYAKKSEGGYQTPNGEYGVLSLDANGLVTLTEDDGTVYAFTAEGKVGSVTSPADSKKPATPIVHYRPGTGQIDRISDPLSVTQGNNPPTYSREVTFVYSGDSAADVGLGIGDSDMSGTACPYDASLGYAAPPADMLCRIIYPGHVEGAGDTTRLFYNSNGQLAAILDPGNELTSFGYDADGRMSVIRDSLANDWLAANSLTPTAASTVEIEYTNGKTTRVTLPAPDGVTEAERPQKSYTYDGNTTYVDVDGLNLPPGTHAKTVTFDSAWRQLTTTSASGLTASQEWNSNDMLLSATGPTGLKTTTIYDDQDRPVDSYGPAPESCFGADREPLASCPFTPAHTETEYDDGLNGLNVVYYSNPALSGAPKAFDFGLDGTGGELAKDWDAAAPAGLDASDNWSLRATGLITFPETGVYEFRTIADDATKLWIDDILVNGDWAGTGAHTSAERDIPAVQAGDTKRIHLAYADRTGDAELDLKWKPPNGTWATVPASALSPDYGLANRTIVHDSAPDGVSGVSDSQVPDLVTAVEYEHPWLGAATASIVDPDGLALRTETSYESPGNGYLRRLSKRLPAAVAADAPAASAGLTLAYYGNTETLADAGHPNSVCGLAADTPQHGFLKSSKGAAPAVGSAMVTEYVYDLWGRTVGSKRTGDPDWTCTSFDARGRAVSTTYPAYGAGTDRTVTNNYAVDGNPLVGTTSDTAGTITTAVDLLGRTVSYTDVWGTVTTPTYESQTGRVLSVTTTISGGVSSTKSFQYDIDGKIELVKLDGETIADPAYDPVTGLLTGVTYPNGPGNAGNGTALGNLTRNSAGAPTGMSWLFPDSTVVTDAVVRSQSGRIIQNTLTDTWAANPATETATYSYDNAGRLIEAVLPRHVLSYGFADTTGCGTGVAQYAGRSGNRTNFTDVKDGGTPTTTTYCYDPADRLVSTTVTNAPAGANALLNGDLSAANLTYDAHGNTTRIADQELFYDVTDRHVKTVLDDGTVLEYLRDVTGRIVQRSSTAPGQPVEVLRYTYAGSGLFGVLDGNGNLIQQSLSLPGGVSVTLPVNGDGQWSYPNLHGDSIILTNHVGIRIGVRAKFTPFGQPIDPSTGDIGTLTADDAVNDTSPGKPTMVTSANTANCMSTKARSRPSKWAPDNTSPPWAGSSKSTR